MLRHHALLIQNLLSYTTWVLNTTATMPIGRQQQIAVISDRVKWLLKLPCSKRMNEKQNDNYKLTQLIFLKPIIYYSHLRPIFEPI